MQFAALERIKHFILSVEDDRRGFDAAMFGFDCGYLDHRAPEITGQQAQTTVGTERRRMSAQDRSDEHTSELQSLMRISYAVFCLKSKEDIYLNSREQYS